MWKMLKKTNPENQAQAQIPVQQPVAPAPQVIAVNPAPKPVIVQPPVIQPQPVIYHAPPPVQVVQTPPIQQPVPAPAPLTVKKNVVLSKSMPEKKSPEFNRKEKAEPKEKKVVSEAKAVTVTVTKAPEEKTPLTEKAPERITVWAKILLEHKEVNAMDKKALPIFFKNNEDRERLENEIFELAELETDASYITLACDIVGQIQELFKDFTPH